MNAETIARELGGVRSGAGWVMRCPAHDDHKPSLSLSDTDDGRILVKCFAKCDARDVIAKLRARGLWPHLERDRVRTKFDASRPSVSANSARAMQIWKEATPATGTLTETYLRSRGITMALPTSLRFHPQLKHPSGQHFPAMVALVSDGKSGTPVAIHRTYLSADGNAKAEVSPNKMMLGSTRGGAVRLSEQREGLLVGEGIETTLSAMQATGRPGWAALSTSGLTSLVLPLDASAVTILADGDDAGHKSAKAAAKSWSARGVAVRVAYAPTGTDFNDLLTSTNPGLRSSAA
jgi:hypothetical protein